MAEWPYNTANWQRLRTAKLARDPMCEGCLPHRYTSASHVDHVHAISDGGPAFPGLDELRSLCPPCHSAKTARGPEAGAVKTSKPRRGCDANGNPLDGSHPWAGDTNVSQRYDRDVASDGRGSSRLLDVRAAVRGIKSLSTGETRARGDTKTQLVSNRNRYGCRNG